MRYYPSALKCLSLVAGWCQTDYTLITHTHPCMCKCTCMRTNSPELMKIQLRPKPSNGANNRESLGALRVSDRLQDACGLDRQAPSSVIQKYNPHPHVRLAPIGAKTSLTTRRQGRALPEQKNKRPLRLLITRWGAGSSITHMTYPIVMLFHVATDHVMHMYCILVFLAGTVLY